MARFSRRTVWKRLFRVAAFRGAEADKGGVATEFALLAPLLIIIIMGIIQFGWAFFVQHSMINAAREAARKLAVGEVTVAGVTSCPSTAGSAEAMACGLLDFAGMTFTVNAVPRLVPVQ